MVCDHFLVRSRFPLPVDCLNIFYCYVRQFWENQIKSWLLVPDRDVYLLHLFGKKPFGMCDILLLFHTPAQDKQLFNRITRRG